MGYSEGSSLVKQLWSRCDQGGRRVINGGDEISNHGVGMRPHTVKQPQFLREVDHRENLRRCTLGSPLSPSTFPIPIAMGGRARPSQGRRDCGDGRNSSGALYLLGPALGRPRTTAQGMNIRQTGSREPVCRGREAGVADGAHQGRGCEAGLGVAEAGPRPSRVPPEYGGPPDARERSDPQLSRRAC
jgi:hypothetical protein